MADTAATHASPSNVASFDFAGSRVVVTGGTSGIGHAIAVAFAAAGAAVTVTGTRSSPDDYDAELDGFDFHELQLSDPASIDAFAAELHAAHTAIDVLVNNAGATFPGGRDEWEPDAFAASLQLNAVGPMRLTTALHPLLRASTVDGGASVINLASMSAYRSVPMVPGYGASKAATVNLTMNLARRWVGDGIRVNALAPGLIDTPMTAPMQAFPELLDAELAHTPMARMGAPDEVAGAALFLASSSARFVTGHTLAVDGGYLLP
jgi:NAD(P)-dependent dehydrogenase (short-subunit alcohol dehydrogenase family)